jgi:hypothetical protein
MRVVNRAMRPTSPAGSRLDYAMDAGIGRPGMDGQHGRPGGTVANRAARFRLSGRRHPSRCRAAAAAAVLLASASACGGPCEAPRQASADAAGIAPRDTAFCIAPEPGRAAAEAAAIRAVGGPIELRVSSFTAHHDGSLVSVSPAAADAAGGGGLVWVDRDGCVTLIRRSE